MLAASLAIGASACSKGGTRTQVVTQAPPPLLAISTTTLAAATVGVAYSATLTAANGTTPYAWSLAQGSLPPGLSLAAGGTITGTPTAPGTYAFTVRVDDAAAPPANDTQNLSIQVVYPSLAITTTTLPSGTVGTAYSSSLAASGGAPPYTFAPVFGLLRGLSLSGAGGLTGTPILPGSGPLWFTVSDSASPPNRAVTQLSIQISPATLSVVNASLPPADAGVPYAVQLHATGGVAPHTWSSGALPSGLTLTTGGFLSGTPTGAGTTSITFTVTDSATPTAATANRSLSLTVYSGATITVSGQFSFANVPIGSNGELDLTTPIPPSACRGCTVWLEDQSNTGVPYSVGVTDGSGNYSLIAPASSTVKVWIESRMDSAAGAVTVVNYTSTTNPKAVFAVFSPNISVGASSVTGQNFVVPDSSSHFNGAFNILDVIYTVNQQVLAMASSTTFGYTIIEPHSTLRAPTLLQVAGSQKSYFDGARQRAFILGDRNTDSDDCDDSVIAHEYMHYLQTRLSRSDNIGGFHTPLQVIDPRVAFGEGSATFFGQAFLNSLFYEDSLSPLSGFGVDLESAPTTGPGLSPGYWDEFSVAKVLWDCFDANADTGDALNLSLGAFWTVFTADMPNHTFTYLIDFMDSLYARNTSSGTAIANILAQESISYTPGGSPSISNPWPTALPNGTAVTGGLDGSATKQFNLMNTLAVYSFSVASSRNVTLSLTNTGAGTNPFAPRHLDVYLFSSAGSTLAFSLAPPGAGYTHQVTFTVPTAGTYGVAVTAAYTIVGGGPGSFGSGAYSMTGSY